jgi:hypothetical protein
MANGGIAKACKNQKELETYVAFINAQCYGKAGFPVDAKAMACKYSSVQDVDGD